jgi:hypothetical protein
VSTPQQAAGNRDTRLLITTLAVSAGMLLILARFRFPDRDPSPQAVVTVPAAPLERLAARATYDELARVLGGLSRQIGPGVAAFRAETEVPGIPGLHAIELPAIRIASERAIALIGAGRSIDGVGAGRSIDGVGASEVEGVLAIDAPRGLALVKVLPGSAVPFDAVVDARDLAAPGYAAAVEMTRNGPAVRPFYFGRVDQDPTDARWGRPLWRFTGLQQSPSAGSAILLLDGRLVGIGAPDDRGFLVIPGAALKDAALRLETGGSISLADLGIETAPLTAELRSALAVDRGVAVTHVFNEGPARGLLQPSDVVQRIGNIDIASEDDYRLALSALRSGNAVAVSGMRRDKSFSVTVVASGRERVAAVASRLLGLDLRPLPNSGSEVVRVTAKSAAAVAGIIAGDVITAVDRSAAPAPAAIERAYHQAADGSRLVLGVERGRRHLLLVLSKP